MEFLTGAVQKEDLGIAEILAGDVYKRQLCDMARDAKRVLSKPTETDNDK